MRHHASPNVDPDAGKVLAHYQVLGVDRLRRKLVDQALNIGRYWALTPGQVRNSVSLALGDLTDHPMWADPTEPAAWMHWCQHPDERVREIIRQAMTNGAPRGKARLVEHLRREGLVCANVRLWRLVSEVLNG